MSNSPNDSLTNIKRRNTRDIKSSKEQEITLRKVKTSKRSINSMAKLQPKKNEKIKKNKNNEPRRTFYSKNSKILFSDRAQKNFLNIIKREKSADHLKKKSSSLRERIRQYFTEMGYFDTNFNLNYLNNKKRKISSSNKNYNTLILMKQNQKEENKKYYLSPEKFEQNKKNNFYKRLLNLRTVTGPKINNNEVLLYNCKENYNINSNNTKFYNEDNNNNASIVKSTFRQKNKNKKTNKNDMAKSGKNVLIKKNRYDNSLYFSQNNFNNIGLIQQKNDIKIKKNNPLSKSSNNSNIGSYNQNKLTSNQNIKMQISGDDKSPSIERITVNKNEENIINNNAYTANNINSISNSLNNNNATQNQNNYYKINVRRIDSMTNYYSSNSININLNKNETEENKNIKINTGCFTEENEMIIIYYKKGDISISLYSYIFYNIED